jgi:hypothetical protein
MKKMILSLTAGLGIYLMTIAQCADPLNIYHFTFAGKNYEVIKEKKTWSDAAACAVERGGYLVEINNLNEQQAVYNAIINGAGVSPTYTTVPNGGGIAYVWIGGTDQQTEGTWLWDGNNDNTGLHFWTGQGANGSGNGAAVGGAYYNWGGTSTGTPMEPDNYGSGQHYSAIGLAGWPSGSTMLGTAGEWNDITGTNLLYFVVEYSSGVGFRDHQKGRVVSMYPNPANGKVRISSRENIRSIEISDMQGRVVFQNFVPDQDNIIDISSARQGLYMVRVSFLDFCYIGKLLLH